MADSDKAPEQQQPQQLEQSPPQALTTSEAVAPAPPKETIGKPVKNKHLAVIEIFHRHERSRVLRMDV